MPGSEFISLLGGAAARGRLRRGRSSPSGCGASACSGARPRTIRMSGPPRGVRARAAANLGWTDGSNLRIDYRWGAGDADRIRRNAAALVALAPDVILTTGSATWRHCCRRRAPCRSYS